MKHNSNSRNSIGTTVVKILFAIAGRVRTGLQRSADLGRTSRRERKCSVEGQRADSTQPLVTHDVDASVSDIVWCLKQLFCSPKYGLRQYRFQHVTLPIIDGPEMHDASHGGRDESWPVLASMVDFANFREFVQF